MYCLRHLWLSGTSVTALVLETSSEEWQAGHVWTVSRSCNKACRNFSRRLRGASSFPRKTERFSWRKMRRVASCYVSFRVSAAQFFSPCCSGRKLVQFSKTGLGGPLLFRLRHMKEFAREILYEIQACSCPPLRNPEERIRASDLFESAPFPHVGNSGECVTSRRTRLARPAAAVSQSKTGAYFSRAGPRR